jgi:hypothetical protein
LSWSGWSLALDFLPAPMKCLCCQEVFQPAPGNRGRQEFCTNPACRQASKRESQRRWLSKPENRDYFRGPEQVERVRTWRRAHPGYWRKTPRKPRVPLQDSAPHQTPTNQQVVEGDPQELFIRTLQDIGQVQTPLLVGIMAQFIDSPLQEDIVGYVRRMVAKGQDLLGMSSSRSHNSNIQTP